MYTEIQVSYGPVMFVNLKDFYLEKRKDTTGEDKDAILSYYLVGVYSGRDYDLDENIYEDLKEKYNQMIQDEINQQVRLAMLGQAASKDQPEKQLKKVRETLQDAEI